MAPPSRLAPLGAQITPRGTGTGPLKWDNPEKHAPLYLPPMPQPLFPVGDVRPPLSDAAAEFLGIMEEEGVIEALTEALTALYNTPVRPRNVVDFLNGCLGETAPPPQGDSVFTSNGTSSGVDEFTDFVSRSDFREVLLVALDALWEQIQINFPPKNMVKFLHEKMLEVRTAQRAKLKIEMPIELSLPVRRGHHLENWGPDSPGRKYLQQLEEQKKESAERAQRAKEAAARQAAAGSSRQSSRVGADEEGEERVTDGAGSAGDDDDEDEDGGQGAGEGPGAEEAQEEVGGDEGEPAPAPEPVAEEAEEEEAPAPEPVVAEEEEAPAPEPEPAVAEEEEEAPAPEPAVAEEEEAPAPAPEPEAEA